MPPMPVIADNQGFASLQLRIWPREFGAIWNFRKCEMFEGSHTHAIRDCCGGNFYRNL